MYLAPLTLNYFFEKAFANDEVMEAFLSDLFLKPVKIIKRLERVHKLTNEAFYIKFDFRCKIEGQEVVVEMQRGYRKDIVKRFHLYHGVGSALQLEQLPIASTLRGKTVRDYTGVVPVLTVIWMVHDSLKTKEDFLKYQLFPSALADFVKNEELWKRGNIKELNDVRTSLNRMLDYNHKDLDFLAKNQLIFIFQRNILKNRPNTPLYKWIKFASLTNKEDNTKADFVEFENDKNFEQMMRVLNIEKLENVDIDVIDQLKEDLEDMRGVIREEVIEEVRNELQENIEKEVTAKVEREVTAKVEREVTAKVEREVTAKVEREVTAKVEREVTAKVEREVTAKVEREVTAKVEREVTAKVEREVMARVEKAEKERQLREKKQNIYEGIKMGLSASSIAQIFSVSEEFVLSVKKEFHN